jgi:dTDP-4-amino-4,6-dideoxygalactose transaminase
MKITCANPSAQFLSQQLEIESAILRVVRRNQYILGEEVDALEKEFASYIGVIDAIGVANGTDAIEIALRALDIGQDDEVITVSHTAVATVAAIEASGAIPVLVDVDPRFYTIDPKRLQEAVSGKTRAVIVVHLYGQSADLDALTDFCEKNQLKLIEDVSQAHGATWRGKRLGSFGEVSCFSCYPTKNLGAIGDAGLITTNNAQLARKIRMLREYGWKDRNKSQIIGRNSRLDEIQAAILRVKLPELDSSNNKRKEIAIRYFNGLKSLPVILPEQRNDSSEVFHLFVIRSKYRDELKKFLLSRGIEAGIHYPIPIHHQPAYENRIRTSQSMNVTETLANEVLSLPIYPELSFEQVSQVINAVVEFFRTVKD